MKLELGLNGHLLQHDIAQFDDMISPSWMKATWRFAVEHDIIVSDDIPQFAYLRQHDQLLMDGFVKQGLSKSELSKVNTCRLHLQVLSIADITDGCGEHITSNAWNGVRAPQHTSRYKWGFQPRPPETFWLVWKKAVGQLCGRDRRLHQPLGYWTAEGCQHWMWWYDSTTDSLYRRHSDGSFNYPDKSSRNTRQAAWRFNDQIKIPCTIPSAATPCTVIQQGQFLLLQGTASRVVESTPTTPSSFPSFQLYLASLTSQVWVFETVQFQGLCESIAQSIQQGTCSCVTDGSFKDQHGTAAWKIVDLDKPEHFIEGQVVTPGFPYQQDAYRSELSGLYASVMAINALTAFYDLQVGSITMACDNSLAIRMTSYDPLGTNPSSCAQFDLVMAIQQAKTSRITWIHKHVKGHQDDHPDLILTPLEELNVDMDNKAKCHRTRTHSIRENERLHDFDFQPWSISLGGQKVVSNLASACKDWCQRPRIHRYWIDKGRFTREELNHIESQTAVFSIASKT
jgi:hypothetical protein